MKIGYMLLTLVLVAPMNNTLAKNESIAPFEATGDGPRFYIDYSNFQGVDNLTYTEFYIQISYNELQFVKRGNRFVSGYDLEFEVLDEENNVIESYSNTDIFQVDNFSETESMTKARVSMIAFTFEPGVYRIKAAMLDRETRKSAKLHRKFTAHSFKQENLLISDIQFSQKIEVCNEQRPFVKNSRYVEPNVVRLFAKGLEDIFLYFEVYNLTHFVEKPNYNYTAYFSILNKQNKETVEFQQTNKISERTAAHSLRLKIEQFSDGEYDLTVRILDEASGQSVETTKSFTVIGRPIAALDNHGTLGRN